MDKLFGYLTHMETVANDHAEHVDSLVFEQRVAKRSAREAAMAIKVVKADLAQTEEESKAIAMVVGANDFKLKSDLTTSIQGIWSFSESNNVGITQFFAQADESFKKLKVAV